MYNVIANQLGRNCNCEMYKLGLEKERQAVVLKLHLYRVHVTD